MTKQKILQSICYTELVYGRINKKLETEYSRKEIEKLIYKTIATTDESHFERKGKNIYITNRENEIRVTINLHTSRVITVDQLQKINE